MRKDGAGRHNWGSNNDAIRHKDQDAPEKPEEIEETKVEEAPKEPEPP